MVPGHAVDLSVGATGDLAERLDPTGCRFELILLTRVGDISADQNRIHRIKPWDELTQILLEPVADRPVQVTRRVFAKGQKVNIGYVDDAKTHLGSCSERRSRARPGLATIGDLGRNRSHLVCSRSRSRTNRA